MSNVVRLHSLPPPERMDAGTVERLRAFIAGLDDDELLPIVAHAIRILGNSPPDTLAERMVVAAYFALQRVAAGVLADLAAL